MLQFLARTRWRIAAVAGQGYRDATAVSGTAYQYELRGVNAVGTETGVLFTDVALTAGAPPALAPPRGSDRRGRRQPRSSIVGPAE